MSSKRRIKESTTTHARKLRSNLTAAENMLWQAIRNKQINGYRFRRQHPIGNYIADFACVENKLVIELDGGQHLDQTNSYEHRTQFLQQQGWLVLLFWNNEVRNNLEGVLLKISGTLSTSPPSSPLGRSVRECVAGRSVARDMSLETPLNPSPSMGKEYVSRNSNSY